MLQNTADWRTRNRTVTDAHLKPLARLLTQMLEQMGAQLDDAA
jgi:hypothetical protein